MKRVLLIAMGLIVIMSISMVGCKKKKPEPIIEEIADVEKKTEEPRVEDEEPAKKVVDEEIATEEPEPEKEVSAGDTIESARKKFEMDLFKAVYSDTESKNIFIAPLPVYMALSMAANGVTGASEREMNEVLYDGFGVDSVNKDNRSRIRDMNYAENVEMHVANSMWLSDALEIKSDVVAEDMERHYDAEIHRADFTKNKTLKDMNNWVTDSTGGSIKRIIDTLSKNADSIMLSAADFKGDWLMGFDEDESEDKIFVNAAGNESVARFMSLSGAKLKVLESKGYIGVVIPYKNEEYQMVVMMPNGISMAELVERVELENLIGTDEDEILVNLRMPKFELSYYQSMIDALEDMGIVAPFENGDDFANFIDGGMVISDIIQRSVLKVDEQGDRPEEEEGRSKFKSKKDEEVVGTKEYAMDISVDRPFICAIMQGDEPMFIGVVNYIESEEDLDVIKLEEEPEETAEDEEADETTKEEKKSSNEKETIDETAEDEES